MDAAIDWLDACLRSYLCEEPVASRAASWSENLGKRDLARDELQSILLDFVGRFVPTKLQEVDLDVDGADGVVEDFIRWSVRRHLLSRGPETEFVRSHVIRHVYGALEVLRVLQSHAASSPPVKEQDVIRDRFLIQRIDQNTLWLEPLVEFGELVGPVHVPREAGERCRVGWELEACLVPCEGGWRIQEILGVLP